MKKRILSLILAFAMAATLAPATALVGTNTAKAAEVSKVIIQKVAKTEAPAKTWAEDKDNLVEVKSTDTGITELSVDVPVGTKLDLYLKANIPFNYSSQVDQTADTNDRYVKFSNEASVVDRATAVGLTFGKFVSTTVKGADNDAGVVGDHVAAVAKVSFDVPKATSLGEYEIPCVADIYDNTSIVSAEKVDLNGDGDTSNDKFILKINVTKPTSDWTKFTAADGVGSVGGKVYDVVRDTSKDVTVTNTLEQAYDDIKGSNAFTAADDIVTKISAESPIASYTTVSTTPSNGRGANVTASATVNGAAPNGTYYFNITQELKGVVLHSVRFGIRVGEGATVTLDPKGGAIYDAEFEKKGDLYVGEFGKQANLFTYNGIKDLPTPIREDMIFDGWYIDNSNTRLTGSVSTTAGDVSYYAKWSDKIDTITLKENGSAVGTSSPASKLKDKLADRTNILERNGYNLLGWSVRPNATVKMYETMAEVNVDMIKTIQAANNNNTLYAVWAPKTFKISFDACLPKDEKLSDYSATSMEPITWSTDQEMSFTEWMEATENKFHIFGYKFIGWSRELGSSNTGGDASKIVYNESTGKDFAPASADVIDILDLQDPSAQNITLHATWEPKVASYVTLKEETGKDLYKIVDVGEKAPDEAGRVGYFVERWTEGTDYWLPKSDPNATAVQKSNAVLTPKFRTEGIEYNMILAKTNTDDYAIDYIIDDNEIGEIQGDAYLKTFSADKKTEDLPDRKLRDSSVATFLGWEAWVGKNDFLDGDSGTQVDEDTSKAAISAAKTPKGKYAWTKLDGIFKGSFTTLDVIKAIEKTGASKSWNTNKSDGVVFFYPVWRYNLADAMLEDGTGVVNSQNITVNYGTSRDTILNMIGAKFFVKKGNELREIIAPNVFAQITLSGSYNPLKAGRYDLKATIYPKNNVSTNSASFTKDVKVNVRNKVDSGFTEDQVVAAGFTAIPDINLAAGANVQDILAALAQKYRVEVLGDNSQKYSLELAEVGRAMEWMYKRETSTPNSTNYGNSIVYADDTIGQLTYTTFDNDKFKKAVNDGKLETTFKDVTFRFALPVNSSMKGVNETGKEAGNLAYIGNDIGNVTSNDQNGNKFVIVDVNVGAGNKPVVTPAEPEKDETDSERPEMKAGPVYRLYNPNNGDHLFTTSKGERNILAAVGWQVDAVTFNTPSSADQNAKPVYRVYNPNSGEHFYTTSKGERNSVVKAGWKYEGVEFYAYSAKSSYGIPVYRLWSPASTDAGSHHITGSKGEYNALGKIGWKQEGVAFRAVKAN